MDYILFVGQEANFQSRSMLIPAEEFLKVRNDDYLLLKRCSIKDRIFTINGINHKIDNLLIQNVIWSGNRGSYEKHEYTTIVGQLTQYADGMEEDCYFDMKDKEWYDNAMCNLCRGFNHVKNYTKLKNSTKYNIVDSFL